MFTSDGTHLGNKERKNKETKRHRQRERERERERERGREMASQRFVWPSVWTKENKECGKRNFPLVRVTLTRPEPLSASRATASASNSASNEETRRYICCWWWWRTQIVICIFLHNFIITIIIITIIIISFPILLYFSFHVAVFSMDFSISLLCCCCSHPGRDSTVVVGSNSTTPANFTTHSFIFTVDWIRVSSSRNLEIQYTKRIEILAFFFFFSFLTSFQLILRSLWIFFFSFPISFSFFSSFFFLSQSSVRFESLISSYFSF